MVVSVNDGSILRSNVITMSDGCGCIGRSPLTVERILTSCSAYKDIRGKYYHNSQLSHVLFNISKRHTLTTYPK